MILSCGASFRNQSFPAFMLFITFTFFNPKQPAPMKIKLTFIVVLFLLANLAQA